MERKEVIELSERFLEAWNTQDVETVIACYTPDLEFRDPNTKGTVNGADAMRRYLKKLFDNWQMHWSLREAYPFSDTDGEAVLWHATLRKEGTDKTVVIDGMDLVLIENGLIKRNEVNFDRVPLVI